MNDDRVNVICTNPECGYLFSSEEWQDKPSMRCPRCETEVLAPGTSKAAPRLELDPPPLPISRPDLNRGIQEAPGRVGPPEHIPEAQLDISVGYYLLIGNRRVGPLEKSKLLGAGLDYGTLVWYPGAKGWRPARTVEALQDVLQLVPPPPPGPAIWGNSEFLPRPETFQSLFNWYLRVTIAGFVFLVLMITFIILWENVHTPINRPGMMRKEPMFEIFAIVAGALAVSSGVASMVLMLILLYQMWKAVQDGYVQISPGSAVGLLLIPIFNFFWSFVAIAGLARECNYFIQRHGCMARPAPTGLALATCICMCIPYVNLITTIPMLLVTMAILKNTASDIVACRLADEAERM